jgi:hypothetical protein
MSKKRMPVIVDTFEEGVEVVKRHPKDNKILLHGEVIEIHLPDLKDKAFDPDAIAKMKKYRETHRGKLTKEMAEKAGEAMAKGLSITHICQLFCISRQSFFEWIKKGNEDKLINNDSDYVYFVDCLSHGKGLFMMHNQELVQQAAEADPKYWAAAAWNLEKGDPEHYGKKDKLEVTFSKDEAFIQAVRNITPNGTKELECIDKEAGDAVPYEEIDD